MARVRSALAIGVALVACGELAPLPEDAGPPETFAHAFARTVCSGLKDCCAKDNLPYDPESCIAILEGDVQREVVLARIPNRTFHPDIATACLKRAETHARACEPPTIRAPFLWAKCFDVYSDDAPFGAPCKAAGDCASGRCGGFFDGDRRCVRLVPRIGDGCARNADCHSLDESATTDLYCDAMSKVCVETPNDTCGSESDCTPQAPCCSNARCIKNGSAIGAACSCPVRSCADGGTCGYSLVCEDLSRGGPCDANGMCGAGDICDVGNICASRFVLYCKGP